MDRWTDCWMSRIEDGQMDKWLEEQDRRGIDGQMVGGVGQKRDRWIGSWMSRIEGGQMDRWIDCWMSRIEEGQIDRWLEEQNRRLINGCMVRLGEEGQPQRFLVRATFSSFFRPSHLGTLVLRLFCVKKFPILEDKTIFLKSGHVRAYNMDGRMAMIISCRNLQTHENDVKFMVFTIVYGSNRSERGRRYRIEE